MTAALADVEPLPWPSSNKKRTLLYRDEVLGALHAAGLTTARRPAPPEGRRGAAHLHDAGQVEGLPGLLLLVRRQATMDLSGSLDDAARRAALSGLSDYAVVHHRRRHGVPDSYAVAPLHYFCRLLRSSR